MATEISYDQIRKHYEALTPEIIAVSKQRKNQWTDPYSRDIDWLKVFTPIELDAWQDIRGYGQVPLYPQYPIGKIFVDFGNPFLRIALECDGKEFHQDKAKDRRRDEQLQEAGWIVFRISGSDCKKILYPDEYAEKYEYQLREYYLATVEGLLRSIDLVIIRGFNAIAEDDDQRHLEYTLGCECLQNRSGGLWEPKEGQ